VARPSRWGNPFPVEHGDHATAVARFAAYLQTQPALVAGAREALRGKDLMCFCPLSEPCHAEIWLTIVNEALTANSDDEPPDAMPPTEEP
jgi:hypothetical protein